MNARYASLTLALLLAASVLAPRALAQAGTLDPTFGDGGIVLFGTGYVGAYNLALQPDGKIVVAGSVGNDAALWRFNPDGTPDQSFGTGGVVTMGFEFGGQFDRAALLPGGDILAIGCFVLFDACHFFGARFHPDGTRDPSFNLSGPIPAGSLHVRPDGRFVLTGSIVRFEGISCVAVQYLPDGTLDLSFGEGGQASVAHGLVVSCGGGALLNDGRLVLFLSVETDTGAAWGAARLLEDGTLDPTFDGDGLALTTAGISLPFWEVTAGAVSPDGSITVGNRSCPFTCTTRLLRLTAEGASDSSFGTDGIATFPGMSMIDLAPQSDGKIIATGAGISASVARVLSDGMLDATFGTGGVATLPPLGDVGDFPYAVVLDAEGRIVVVGMADNHHPSSLGFLARFENDQAVVAAAAPLRPPVVLNPGGGSFDFRVTLTNTTDEPQTVQVWSAVTGPAAREPVLGPRTVTLPAGAAVTRTITQQVPAGAPAGTYTYYVRVGAFPSAVGAWAAFTVTKRAVGIEAPAAGGASDWAASGWSVSGAERWDEVASASAALPEGYALSEPRPNPSRDRAQLTLEVAAAQDVRAEVYDALGRRVAVLFDGTAEAGVPVPLSFEAGALPSGAYVVRVTGERFAVTRRVTLVR